MFQVQMQQHVRVCSMRGMVITVVGKGCVCTCITSSLDLCCGGIVPSFPICIFIHLAMGDGG